MKKYQKKDIKNFIVKVLIGFFTGICNGLFGGGGGMVLVPAFEFVLKKDEKKAHATALLVILPVSLIGAATYVICNGFDFSVGLPVSLGNIAGGIAGACLLKKMSGVAIISVFSLVMLAAGVKMAFF